ncbi:thioesterase II family protein [Actinomadura sp. 9N215]|uniref:thioesterase II family protein n=1 Tax=Actinomadura sp. 9N215 TaxID=3375150 RepID=UPI00378DD72E
MTAGGSGGAVATGAEWLRQFAPAAGGAPTLVCLPHAGGSAAFFAPLARALSPALRVLAVQYPGRLDRRDEPPVEDVRELARRIAGALAADAAGAGGGPLAFFGHSMGALVAYETALLGERGHGPVPDRLFVSAARAPHLARVEDAVVRADRSLLDEVLFLGGTSPAVLTDPDLRALILPALRADYRALRGYTAAPGTAVGCPVVALTGDDDPRVAVAEARAWREHTPGPFELRVLPGDHFYLIPRLHEVADAVRADFPGGRR